jgi:hypothetical protein
MANYAMGHLPFRPKAGTGKNFLVFRGILLSFEILTVPFNSDKSLFNCDDLNRFCLNKRVISHKSEFFSVNGKAFWSVFFGRSLIILPQLRPFLSPKNSLARGRCGIFVGTRSIFRVSFGAGA